MKKIVFFLIGFICAIGIVNAETLNISLTNNKDRDYVFDMLIKDIKDSKVNVVSGTITYDENMFSSFEMAAQSGWDIQTVKDENKVKFILINMTDYAIENQKLVNIKTVVNKNNKDFKLSLDNLVSSSSDSIINVSDVEYKHEVIETPIVLPNKENEVQVPDEEFINKVEEEKDDETLEDDGETKEDFKDETKKSKKDKKTIRTRDIISLIISFLVLGVVIAAGIFAYKENKKDGGK